MWDLIGNEAKSVVPQNADNSNDKDDEFLLEEDDPVLREFRQQVRARSSMGVSYPAPSARHCLVTLMIMISIRDAT